MLTCALVMIVLDGCTGSTSPSTGSDATAPAGQSALTPDLAAVQATLTRYFAALKGGDFTAAMNERCRATRIPAEQRDLFLSQVKGLFKMGALTGVEVSDKPSLRLLPVETSTSAPIP